MNPLDARRRLLGRNVYKKTVEGNPAIAQGSLARRYPGIIMQGWTEQDSYEGKNLLPVDVGQEITGVAATDSATFEEDGVHAIYESIVSGEARDIYMYGSSNVSVESGYVEVSSLTPGDYRLVNDNIGISLHVVAWRNGASVVLGYANNVSTKITVQDGDKFRIFLRCNIIGDTNVKIHPMIVKEGDDTTVYEPYTGGAPSPSPDYPQEIMSEGKYNEESQEYEYGVKLTGANLFDGSQFGQNGKVIHIDATSGNRDITGIDYKPNTTYTISIEGYEIVTPNGNWTANFTVYYTDGTFDQRYTGWLVGNPLVTNKNKTIRRIVLGNPWGVGETITGIMVNEGSTALPYEPYRLPQTVTLTSDRPLTKWDKLEKRNGQWGWVYKSAEKVLDGTERYDTGSGNYISDFSSNCYTVISDMVIDGRDNAFMNRLSNIDYSWTLTDAIGFSKNLDQLHVRISNADLGTTGESSRTEVNAAMKAYMAQQYEEGNPFVFWYETTEETFVPLSETEQEQMNALYTFRPTTVLSNDCECNMSLTYKTKKSLQPVSGGSIRKPSGVTSYFTFGVKWNQINKIVLKASGITQTNHIFFCGEGTKQPWIGLNNLGVLTYMGLRSGTCNLTSDDILDGQFH